MDRTITDQEWQEYQEKGYLKLGRLLDEEQLTRLQDRIDSIMMGTAPVNYDRMLMQIDTETGRYEDAPMQGAGFKGPTLNYRKIQDLEYDPVFLEYMQQPVFRDICKRVYGQKTSVSCFRAMFMNKPARKGTVLPWHQDGGENWQLDHDPLVTVWTALDPSTKANGCVQVIPGSHLKGLLTNWGHTISEELVRIHCPEDEIEYLELEAGEVVVLHNWLLHRSDVNSTDIPRRAFSVCYTDAKTRRSDGLTFPVIFGEGALTPENVALVHSP